MTRPSLCQRKAHVPAWWRIIPKRTADDCYRRRFATRRDAEALMQGRRHRYKVVAFNRHGKLIP